MHQAHSEPSLGEEEYEYVGDYNHSAADEPTVLVYRLRREIKGERIGCLLVPPSFTIPLNERRLLQVSCKAEVEKVVVFGDGQIWIHPNHASCGARLDNFTTTVFVPYH